MNQDDSVNKWKPGVEKQWLHLLAGVMWSGVGVMLISLAVGWLLPLDRRLAILLATVGLFLALIIHRFAFSRLAVKNRRRIDDLAGEKNCILAFQEWKSYPLVAVMIAMGITLRSSPLPKHYLAVIYIAIGLGLFLASLQYYGLGQRWEDFHRTVSR